MPADAGSHARSSAARQLVPAVNANPARAAAASEYIRYLTTEEALDFAEAQVRSLVTKAPGRMPTFTRNGRWVFDQDPWAPTWTGGFLTGMLWTFAHRTGDRWWRDAAEAYCLGLENRKYDPGTNDLGSVLEPSWGRWYDTESADRAKGVLIEGGQ